jgi:hypothetical protein
MGQHHENVSTAPAASGLGSKKANAPLTESPDAPRPEPIDDPLAQAIDQFSDEVEPIATTPDTGTVETPTTSEGDEEPTA